MCQFKVCYYNERIGYVVQCAECRQIQWSFNSILMDCTIEEFEKFWKYLQTFQYEQYSSHNENARCMLLRMPNANARLLVNKRELEQLINMFDVADSEIKVHALIELFN